MARSGNGHGALCDRRADRSAFSRSREESIKGLLALTPDSAEIRQADGTWVEVPATQVILGALARVKPGARIPLDGRVVAGNSAVNQAPVTGESIPVDKAPGDLLFAGTINDRHLEFEVTAIAANTTLARIIHAVEQAQGSARADATLVDRFAAIYTPAVFVIAVAVALIGPWLFGWDWSQAVTRRWSCSSLPARALVIATPVTVVSGLAAAARRGILIKGGAYLGRCAQAARLGMDKTGTIPKASRGWWRPRYCLR